MESRMTRAGGGLDGGGLDFMDGETCTLQDSEVDAVVAMVRGADISREPTPEEYTSREWQLHTLKRMEDQFMHHVQDAEKFTDLRNEGRTPAYNNRWASPNVSTVHNSINESIERLRHSFDRAEHVTSVPLPLPVSDPAVDLSVEAIMTHKSSVREDSVNTDLSCAARNAAASVNRARSISSEHAHLLIPSDQFSLKKQVAALNSRYESEHENINQSIVHDANQFREAKEKKARYYSDADVLPGDEVVETLSPSPSGAH